MIHTTFTIAATLFLAFPVKADLYPKSSSILSINGNDYDRIIAQSNYTSIIEFYSPHCIHCKNLVPTYEKVAQNLKGLAKVAAVNCEKESNRLFCDRAGIRGFPTLNIVKPGKTPGKPIVHEYGGARSAKSIVNAVIDKIPNLVEKLPEENVEQWIQDAGESPVAILFTNKPRINPLLKALAIEFKGNIKFAHVQVSNDGKVSTEKYEIKKLPTIMLVRGEIDELLRYDDDMKKDSLVKFLSQGAAPNPDPAPLDKTETTNQSSTQKPKILKPTKTPITVSPLPVFEKEHELIKECLGPKTSTCLIALLPQSHDSTAPNLIDALTQLTHKYKQQKRLSIPTLVLPESNPQYENLKNKLSLESKAVIIAVNGKRAWWGLMSDADFSSQSAIEFSLEKWISAIQLGEGEKKKIPAGLISEESEKILTDTKVGESSDSIESSDEKKVAKQDESAEEKYSPEEKVSQDEKESSEEKDSLAENEPSVENDHPAENDPSAENVSQEERSSLEEKILSHAEESSGEGEGSKDEVSEKIETKDSENDHDEL